ncbi:ephrin type-A receptor 4-B-like [Sycon ciliatum]|uniref:ephrin type-A receptor 4-B-like n=1 Tax=Sycon ciliatum TaxID=27933 RepID=UPI0031F677CA
MDDVIAADDYTLPVPLVVPLAETQPIVAKKDGAAIWIYVVAVVAALLLFIAILLVLVLVRRHKNTKVYNPQVIPDPVEMRERGQAENILYENPNDAGQGEGADNYAAPGEVNRERMSTAYASDGPEAYAQPEPMETFAAAPPPAVEESDGALYAMPEAPRYTPAPAPPQPTPADTDNTYDMMKRPPLQSKPGPKTAETQPDVNVADGGDTYACLKKDEITREVRPQPAPKPLGMSREDLQLEEDIDDLEAQLNFSSSKPSKPKKPQKPTAAKKKEPEQDLYGVPCKAKSDPAKSSEDLTVDAGPQVQTQISSADIQLLATIKSGAVTSLHTGNWKQKDGGAMVKVVAKKLITTTAKKARADLRQEARTLGRFFHRNVVELYGVVDEKRQLMLVMEAFQGTLADYLPTMGKNDPSCTTQFMMFIKDIAAGMQHISELNHVHKNLSSAVVYLSANQTCKIGGFDIVDQDLGEYVNKEVVAQMAFTAPEALDKNDFTTASDVWSFAFVITEVFTFGAQPKEDMMSGKILGQSKVIYRPQQPTLCPDALHMLQEQCWDSISSNRPNFKAIIELLDSI